MGNITTVTGEISSDDLGVTLPHEHLLIDGTTPWIDEVDDVVSYRRSAIEKRKIDAPVTMELRSWLEYNPGNYDNFTLDNIDLACEEVGRFAELGGETVVDVTGYGIGRDPRALRRIANRTGLNVIAGTGYYMRQAHPPNMDEKTAEGIANEIVSDLEEGMDDTNIRAGIIGEIGATHGFLEHENEVTSFRGAAMAQQRTGAPITIHPPFFYKESHDVLDVLEEAGADLENVILGHMDPTIRADDSLEYHQSLADRGPFLEFDIFGQSGYSPAFDKTFPLDADKIQRVVDLFDDYGDQLLVSQDTCQKIHLKRYGGFGYDHILRNIVPRFRRRGLSNEAIDRLLIENPARALAHAE
jgi:phosphotriesterase-related protein